MKKDANLHTSKTSNFDLSEPELTHELQWAKEKIAKGDKRYILYALSFYLMHDPYVPEWLHDAFFDAYNKGRGYEIRSWDDVFGKPMEKGVDLITQRGRFQKRWQIFHRIRQQNKTGNSLKDLFVSVGKEFGVSKTVAEELYYEVRNLRRAPFSKPSWPDDERAHSQKGRQSHTGKSTKLPGRQRTAGAP
jgi:hypothetical protein